MNRTEIIEGIKRDIVSFNSDANIDNLTSKRAIVARDIILPLIEKMDDEWLLKNWDIDIMAISVLDNGAPSMKRVTRLYPELLK